jgi:hypothetical protein
MTPYEVLGVEPTATEAEIRRAYVALARRFHPDVHPGGEARMQQLNEAWSVLGDRARRAAWDRDHAPPPEHGFTPHDPDDDGFDPWDLVDVPYRSQPPRQQERRGFLTVAPVLVFGLSVVAFTAGIFFDSPAILGAGVVLFSLSCIGMVGVLLVLLADARRDEG